MISTIEGARIFLIGLIIVFSLGLLFGLALPQGREESHWLTAVNINLEETAVELRTRLINELITRYNPGLEQGNRELIGAAILEQGQRLGVDPFLIAGVIAAESSFRPAAVSPCKAQGLMQITSGVCQMMKVKTAFDIRENIRAGVEYLQHLQSRFDQVELVLAAYNAGPTRVARLGRVPRIKETVDYVARVMGCWNNLNQSFWSQLEGLVKVPGLLVGGWKHKSGAGFGLVLKCGKVGFLGQVISGMLLCEAWFRITHPQDSRSNPQWWQIFAVGPKLLRWDEIDAKVLSMRC